MGGDWEIINILKLFGKLPKLRIWFKILRQKYTQAYNMEPN
jgi:hypothetical protein